VTCAKVTRSTTAASIARYGADDWSASWSISLSRRMALLLPGAGGGMGDYDYWSLWGGWALPTTSISCFLNLLFFSMEPQM